MPALPQAPTSCLPYLQNVLELTLCDKDILGSKKLSVLLFDLESLKPGQPHRHTFPLNQQVSHSTCVSNKPSSRRGGPAQGTEEGSPNQHRPGLQDRPAILPRGPLVQGKYSALKGANT